MQPNERSDLNGVLSPPGDRFAFDEFLLDMRAESLLRNGKRVVLGARPTKLLVALVNHRDRVVGKDELLRLAWPGFTVTENNLAVAVLALRRALDDRPYIRSVYGQGYRFVGPAAPSPAQPGPPAGASPPDLPSLAVLPFRAPGDAGSDDAVLGEGIAEDILSELSRNRWLTVIARSSSFSFGEHPGPLSAVAKQLGVRYVVEGSIRRSGRRLRVVAHLSDATSNAHLVSERFERDLADIFDLQDEITARIVAAVRPVLHEAEGERALRQHPASIDAWAAYRRGLWHVARWGDDDIREATAMFRRAIDIDPRYAPGWYGTAQLFLQVGSGHRPIMPADWQRQGESFALRALELDGRDSEAHGTVAFARQLRGDHEGALAAADDALRLNHNDAMAHSVRGAALVFGGRAEQGIDAIRTCLRLSPRDPRLKIRHMHIGLGLFFMGQWEAAEAQADVMMRRWPDYGPGFRLKAMALAERGEAAAARPFLERALALEPTWFAHHSHAQKSWYRPADFEAATRALAKAGWTGGPPEF